MSSVDITKVNSIPRKSFSSTSSSSISISISETSNDGKGLKEKPKKKKMNKFLKIVLWILGILLFIVIAYIIWTVICNITERNKLDKYAKTHTNKVEIDGHMMNYNIAGESNNITIIALPGFATYAPVIEYKSLYDSLSDKFKVVVPEPFGYGFSDSVDKERTLENVVSELHEFTKKIGIDKYYLMGHSLGGLYSLYWANHHTNETLGFIGLDCSVPGQEPLGTKESIDSTYNSARIYKKLGLLRVASLLNKKETLMATDFNYKNMTEEEIEINRLIAVNNAYNDCIMNEKDHIFDHLEKLKDVKFPESVPVINFVTQDNPNGIQDPLWVKLHEQVITNKTHSEVDVIPGGHFLHYTHKEEVVKKIKEWVI
jgi:pimeloyl-ACP methyl ester carboxylesterase